jgi:ribosomal protein S18 acetylase RimI-like enzyme
MDDIATHFLLRLVPSLIPVGTVRTYKPKDADYYKLSRLAVLPNFRQLRFGRELVLALHDWVAQDAKESALAGKQSFVEVVSHSQIHVKQFYAK